MIFIVYYYYYYAICKLYITVQSLSIYGRLYASNKITLNNIHCKLHNIQHVVKMVNRKKSG